MTKVRNHFGSRAPVSLRFPSLHPLETGGALRSGDFTMVISNQRCSWEITLKMSDVVHEHRVVSSTVVAWMQLYSFVCAACFDPTVYSMRQIKNIVYAL